MTGESWRGPSKDGVPPQSVGRVLWRAKPSGRTARPHLLRISGARKSVVAVTGEARLPQDAFSIDRDCGASYSMSAMPS